MTTEVTRANNPFAVSMPAASPTGLAASDTDQARAVAEVQSAIVCARMNPRDPMASMDRILNACMRPSLANVATYAYSRGGSEITGPSIRLAEALAQGWGNIQYGIRELSQKGGVSTVQAYAWDVETNTRREVVFQVALKRDTRKGSYALTDSRDIYELVANQGARRLRACILSVIPGDVTEAALDQCARTQAAHVDISKEGISALVETFAKFGVSKQQIEKRIQRRLESILPAQVVSLRRIYASLRDAMSKPEDWFDFELATTAKEESKPKTGAAGLKDKLRKQQAQIPEHAAAETVPQNKVQTAPEPEPEPEPAPASHEIPEDEMPV